MGLKEKFFSKMNYIRGSSSVENYIDKITLNKAIEGKYNDKIDSLSDNYNKLDSKYKEKYSKKDNNASDSNDLMRLIKLSFKFIYGLMLCIFLVIYLFLGFIGILLGLNLWVTWVYIIILYLIVSTIIYVTVFRVNYKNYFIQRLYNLTKMDKYIKKYKGKIDLTGDDIYLDISTKSDTMLIIYKSMYATTPFILKVKDGELVELDKNTVLEYNKSRIKLPLYRFFVDNLFPIKVVYDTEKIKKGGKEK